MNAFTAAGVESITPPSRAASCPLANSSAVIGVRRSNLKVHTALRSPPPPNAPRSTESAKANKAAGTTCITNLPSPNTSASIGQTVVLAHQHLVATTPPPSPT